MSGTDRYINACEWIAYNDLTGEQRQFANAHMPVTKMNGQMRTYEFRLGDDNLPEWARPATKIEKRAP